MNSLRKELQYLNVGEDVKFNGGALLAVTADNIASHRRFSTLRFEYVVHVCLVLKQQRNNF